tara:strand:- start:1460 stop:2518 length:1059 start_codon:yes stop_codon:yes gene_type:complete
MKNNISLNFLAIFFGIILFLSCSSDDSESTDTSTTDEETTSSEETIANEETENYTGTGSITQGLATSTTSNLFTAGQRIAEIGTITASDNSEWIVPAEVNYTDDSFPFAPDLYNPYGTQYGTAEEALAAFDDDNIIEIDTDGDIITGYIFGDNYFELYVNGIPVGKDAVPFTDFNSHLVKFKVNTPYTIAMKLVDWEENLGLGTEESGGFAYHPGDGGMVAVFKDETENTVAVTDSNWKAQTFYTAPIKDLNCPTENGSSRNTSNCDTSDETNGSSFYALHWELPTTWMDESFDDEEWPNATTFTNTTIGVDNKPSYTNYTDIFDDNSEDAQFIWSTNVILDNEVIIRFTVE